MSENTESWHLDKRVPIALILTLALQTSAAVWWAASIQHRVGANEMAVQRLDAVVQIQRDASQSQAIQLGRIEEQIGGLRADIARLVSAIDRGNR